MPVPRTKPVPAGTSGTSGSGRHYVADSKYTRHIQPITMGLTGPQKDTMKANEVWTATLDDKYTVTVIRESPYRAILTITEGEQVLYRQSVGLMYDALFGPDIDDVASWQDIAVRFIDNLQ